MGKKARKFALMGFASGLAQGGLQLVQEAKSERLRQARMAEEAYLRGEERAYREGREEALYKRNRADKEADDKARYEREDELAATRREQELEDAQRRDALERERIAAYGGPREPATGRYLVRVDGKEREITGAELNSLQDAGANVEILAAPAGLKFGGDKPSSTGSSSSAGEAPSKQDPPKPADRSTRHSGATATPAEAKPMMDGPLPPRQSRHSGATITPAYGPRPGDVENGYRFKGGDPSMQSSWERV